MIATSQGQSAILRLLFRIVAPFTEFGSDVIKMVCERHLGQRDGHPTRCTSRSNRAVESWRHRRSAQDGAVRGDSSRRYTTSGSGFIRDAAITIFAVHPSTKAYVSAHNQPHYISRDGEVLAATDYRVRLPKACGSKKKGDRTYWRFRSAQVNETRLLVDGDLEPAIGYSITGARRAERRGIPCLLKSRHHHKQSASQERSTDFHDCGLRPRTGVHRASELLWRVDSSIPHQRLRRGH